MIGAHNAPFRFQICRFVSKLESLDWVEDLGHTLLFFTAKGEVVEISESVLKVHPSTSDIFLGPGLCTGKRQQILAARF